MLGGDTHVCLHPFVKFCQVDSPYYPLVGFQVYHSLCMQNYNLGCLDLESMGRLIGNYLTD